jgi:hypothetical protein
VSRPAPAGIIRREPKTLARPARHRYRLGLIIRFLELVLLAATSLRAAAAILKLFAADLELEDEPTPCANAGRLWILRFGLFALRRSLPVANDWVWMIDHTIQLGPYKCLLIIGIRLSAWLSDRRPLQHEDMTLLNLTPMEHATGEAVHKALQATVERTGAPRAVVSDGGTDLKRGMELFREDHSTTLHRLDLKHKNALLLKKRMQQDKRWQKFVSAANRTKLVTTQTSLAFLNPPSLKTKARYMNLDKLVEWGQRVLAYLDHPRPVEGFPVDQHEVRKKLGWLRAYRTSLQTWSDWLTIVRTAEDHVNTSGYHRRLRSELRQKLRSLAKTPSSRKLLNEMLEFIRQQVTRLRKDERLIGSTEVLESIIGKYKRLQSSHSQGGMTALLLSIGAIVGDHSASLIQQALETISTADVTEWCREHLGQTIQSQRRLTLGAINSD